MKHSIFKQIPLAERPEVVGHLKFNSIINREGAENLLDIAQSGEYILRKSSLGSDCIALSLVAENIADEEPMKINSRNLNIYHFLIDAKNPTHDQFTKAKDPVEEIRKYIEFATQNKEFISPKKYSMLANLTSKFSKSLTVEEETPTLKF
ncbi:Uncharacterised protein [Legionella busanensis]|uniref:SH2 domain-containing protein n=1 Tax=Legionella busanensis TaxID=190655 RepID=A0A378JHZ1_9GAMM|nr:SH2 domain-containing protein [Legionella busanensis]STX50381.1 Uncharacterised protein [Legionella busanensis]